MPTTSNFGWTTPADTDLVKDGAAAIRTLGNGIDTSLVDLKGGTSGQVLAKNSNTDMDFIWVAQDDSNAIQNAIVDAKGDLIAASGADTPVRLAAGTNEHRLVADSAQTAGLKYVADTTNYAIAAKGDLLVGTAADTLQALTVGTNGYTLVADSTEATGLKWVAPSSGSMTLLSTTTLSGASTTISSISGDYTDLLINVYDVTNATANGNLTLQISTPTPTAPDFSVGYHFAGSATINTGVRDGASYSHVPNVDWNRSVDSNSIYLLIPNYADTNNFRVATCWGYFRSSGNAATVFRTHYGSEKQTAVSAIYLANSGGSFSTGTVKIYGVK